MNFKKYLVPVIVLVAVFALVGAGTAFATHSWGKYHWNISSVDNPLVLGDNTTLAWDSSLARASTDWNFSVLKNQVVSGNNTSCDPVLGRVEVCNDEYGNNNWLGIAQIWAYVGKDGHIAQALVKVNDTYFNTEKYNTSAWKNFVICQEVGHTYGLDHQDEVFDNPNLGTCIDYTNDPSTNQHPNQHDYDMLVEKYAHLNGTGGSPGGGKGKKPAGVGAGIDLNDPSAWGKAVRQDARGNNSLYERDLGNGQKLFTFVTWAK